MSKQVYDRDGQVYVRPVGRGAHFTDGDEAYFDDIVEGLAAKAAGKKAPFGWSGYVKVRLHLEVEYDAAADA